MDVRRLSLFLSPLVVLAVVVSLPEAYFDVTGVTQLLSFSVHFVAGLVIWMALWWMFEPISIYATALLPLVVLPISGVSTLLTVLTTIRVPFWFYSWVDLLLRWLCRDGDCISGLQQRF